MKFFLVVIAGAGAVVLGYVILGEWLDGQDSTWLDDGHHFEPNTGDFYPDVDLIGKDPRRFNA